jgi:hypothetical protein
MADDAFALSPINARASMPTEADYEAICGAFMETARGRWFLGEYARRNRNADTRMVLDAVERIEATLASQKAAAANPSLADYLPDISDLVADARRRVLGALPKNDMRPTTEPIQRAAGILRDVAWTLRESGSDTRVCDLLDVQAKAIVDGCTRIHGDQTAPDVPAAVTAALDSLIRRISALAGAHAPRRISRPQRSAEVTAEARPDEPSPPPAEPTASPVATLAVVAPDAPPATSEPTAETVEIAEAQAKQEAATDRQSEPPQAPTPLTPVEVDLQASLSEGLEITEIDLDEKVTEPDTAEQPALPEPVTVEAQVAEPASATPEPPPPAAETPRAAAEIAEPEPTAEEPALAAVPEVVKKPAPSSLGQAALDGGVVTPLRSRYSEALAPIRRMSQAEKIAFFS